MNLAVTVLHNVSDDTFQRFHAGTSRLYHAHTFQVVADGVDQACNLVWELANVDGPEMLAQHNQIYANQVREYRDRMNRSLSVGDVLKVVDLEGDIVLGFRAVAGVGWETVHSAPLYVRGLNSTVFSQSYLAHEDRYRLSQRS